MKQFVLKPWKAKQDRPSEPRSTSSKKPDRETKEPKPVAQMHKKDLLNAMLWEHPLRTLNIGTINGNLRRLLHHEPSLRFQVQEVIQEVVRHASKTKRMCQRAIALYIENLSTSAIVKEDRDLLDCICPRVPLKSKANEEDVEDVGDEPTEEDGDADKDKQGKFLSAILLAMYNAQLPSDNSTMNHQARAFLVKAKEFLPPMLSAGEIKRKMPYAGSVVLRSVTTQLSVELKKHYKHGSYALCEQV